jgi:hypothetical protein
MNKETMKTNLKALRLLTYACFTSLSDLYTNYFSYNTVSIVLFISNIFSLKSKEQICL